MKRFDIAALGEGMVEFNQTRPGEPHYLQGFGGDTSNAAIAAARAGARTAYLSRVGDDVFGRDLLALWQAEGVDTSGVEADAQAPTGLYFVSHGPAGHEFTYRRAGSAAARMSAQWLRDGPAAGLIREARILHVSGISLAISREARNAAFAAMAVARENGTLISFDANLRLKLWTLEEARPAMEQAVSLADIFLPSLDEIALLTGLQDPQAVIAWGHALGARTIVLKLGAQGSIVSDGARMHTMAPLRVDAVDATGAGDCFAGNFLARLAAGDNAFDAARYANAAAALAVQGWGAVAPLPRPEQVRALL
ncbi:sugar kinase [Ramlibacter sp.]|uniref:sugar kinase n=1 Tax=Ramlibacter sp. TaxID=1917967 RepID=UPI0017C5D94E|nr:sugar kinase [Ramlibacter sp.]MBA2673251.1 sugar kinase [Ramlibacter sp.]